MDRPDQIKDRRALKRALSAARFLLFKHSGRCGVSTHADRQFRTFTAAHPEIPAGWIEVGDQRPLSDRIAAATGVPHASPQAFWIVDGKVVWHASHFDITESGLENAVRTFS